MKLLLIKFMLILTGVMVILLPISYYTKVSIDRFKCGKLFTLNSNVNIIAAGDSHTVASINPIYINNVMNISDAGECYYYTYYKLQHYLGHNKSVNKVILSFSYHNISKDYSESWIYNDNKNYYYLDKYMIFIDRKRGRNILPIASNNFIVNMLKNDYGLPNNIYRNSFIIKDIFHKALNEGDINYGGYGNKGKFNITFLSQDKINQRIKGLYNYDKLTDFYNGSSNIMIDYLYKIIKLCADNNVTLYLLNAPLYSKYKSSIPKKAIEDFNNLVFDIVSKHNNVIYLDYSDLLLEDNYFNDVDHVNPTGAESLSRRLNAFVNGTSYCNSNPCAQAQAR